MRKELHPSLSKAYLHWKRTGSLLMLSNIVHNSQKHWLSLCEKVLKLDKDEINLQNNIESLIDAHRL